MAPSAQTNNHDHKKESMSPTNPIFDSLDKGKLQRMLQIRSEYSDGLITLEEAQKRMLQDVGRITPEEFAAAEQLVKADEDPDECRTENVHEILQIFNGLIEQPKLSLPFGHPLDAYLREAEKMKALLQEGEKLLQSKFAPEPWTALMQEIMPYKVHFSRKQNQLYSVLERKGFTRPSTTMWTYDDYVRDEMNKAMDLLQLGNYAAFPEAFRTMATDMLDLISKEELILYPTSLKLISETEFEAMKHGDYEIGFFSIEMPEYKPSNAPAPKGDFMGELADLLARHGLGSKGQSSDEVLHVAEGRLTLDQINLLFRHLPVDLSYVDENELVKFYTDTPHRVFPRSREVIGREVSKCHPPKSVHIVEEIIEKFRRGEQSKAEFWINKPGLFIYIVYVAVRDAEGHFRGVLEMMQDCTHIRSLEGSRTLLTWDEEQQTPEVAEEECNGSALSPNTKLKDLLKRYPQLKEDLPSINPKFAMLQTPIAKVMLPMATLKTMSERSDMPLDELMSRLAALISSYGGI